MVENGIGGAPELPSSVSSLGKLDGNKDGINDGVNDGLVDGAGVASFTVGNEDGGAVSPASSVPTVGDKDGCEVNAEDGSELASSPFPTASIVGT